MGRTWLMRSNQWVAISEYHSALLCLSASQVQRLCSLVSCTKALRQGWNPVSASLIKPCTITWSCIHADTRVPFASDRSYLSFQFCTCIGIGLPEGRCLVSFSNSPQSSIGRQSSSSVYSFFKRKYSSCSWPGDPGSAAICGGFPMAAKIWEGRWECLCWL